MGNPEPATSDYQEVSRGVLVVSRERSRPAWSLPLTRRQVRLALGVLWLVDAVLQAQPAIFGADWWRVELAQSVMGEPSSINHSIYLVVDMIARHAAAWNGLFVAIQAGIGLALIVGRFERAAILASIPWALGIWWVGEGFGTLPTGFALLAAGSPGPVLFYPLLGLLAWPRRQPNGREPPLLVATRWATWSWVVLWAGQALLHLPWAHPPGQVLAANVSEYSLDQPGWLEAIARHTMAVVQAHPLGVTVALGAAEVLVGLGVLTTRGRRPAVVAGIGLSALFWVVVQYLGTIPGGGATDPGSAPLMVLLALALWPPEARPSLPRCLFCRSHQRSPEGLQVGLGVALAQEHGQVSHPSGVSGIVGERPGAGGPAGALHHLGGPPLDQVADPQGQAAQPVRA